MAREHSIEYGSVNGVWWQLRKHKAKRKTGRRAHRRSHPEAAEAFRNGTAVSGNGLGNARNSGIS